MYSLKVTNDKEVRRASVAENAVSYAEVTRIIRSLFPALSRAPFYLQWRDEDDDWVTVSSEPELKEAVRHMSYTDGVLRFTVKVVAEHFGVTCDVCGVNPIPGTRYHCTVRHNYDLCSNCFRAAPQPYPMVKLDTPSAAGPCPYRAGAQCNKTNNAGCQAPPAGPAFGHHPGHGGRFFAGHPHGPAPQHPQGSPPHCRGGRRGPHCRGGRGAPWQVHPLLAALFGEPPAAASAGSEKDQQQQQQQQQQQSPKCPYQQARAHPFVVHLEDLFKELFVDEEASGDEQSKQAAANTASSTPADAKTTADSSTSPTALTEAEALDATTILKHMFDVQDRDLNDEDEALQAAIDQSIRESTAGSTKSAGSSSISTDAPSASSADVNTLPNYAADDDAEEVYSEHSYSLVSPVPAVAAVATPVTASAGPFSPPSAQQQAQQEAAKRAEKERLELEALSQLWFRELNLLGDMGFTNTAELIPLLQREIGAVPATQLGGQGSNSPQAVAAMQRVVATLLSNKREL